MYLYIKSLHLIFVITWFAGLFYIPRLFIYQIEAFHKSSPEKEILGTQLKLMAKRLWFIITWPSAILATGFAIWLLILVPSFLEQGWMHIKLTLVILLAGYTDGSKILMRRLARGQMPLSPLRFRLYNEIPTLFLVALVLLAVDAVLSEPVSGKNSLLTGDLQGKLEEFGRFLQISPGVLE